MLYTEQGCLEQDVVVGGSEEAGAALDLDILAEDAAEDRPEEGAAVDGSEVGAAEDRPEEDAAVDGSAREGEEDGETAVVH